MMLRLMGRAGTASMLSLAMALCVTACSNDYTVSYLYMTTLKALPHGLINGYQIDYQSGSLSAVGGFADRRRGAEHGGAGGGAQQPVSLYGQ